MRRINTSTKATDLHGPGKHGFKPGNSLTGELPTQLSSTYCDDVQEEIANAIEGAGITLGSDQSQLLAAILALADQRAALRAAPTGQPSFHFGSTAPAGWVKRHGFTIGNAASNATERNHADTLALFTLIWNETDNTTDGGAFVIQDSSGSPTIRGASAAADFAANKRIPTPDDRGLVIRALNASGSGRDHSRVLVSSQADAFQGHFHDVNFDSFNAEGGSSTGGGGGNPGSTPLAVEEAITDGSHGTPRVADETRMANRAYLAIMKL